MPQLGESIAEATIVQFLVEKGVEVEAGQDILEVETNKSTLTVTAPCPGVLEDWRVKTDQSYAVGETLGFIETSQEDVQRLGLGVKGGDPYQSDPMAGNRIRGKGLSGNGDNLHCPNIQPTVEGLPVPVNALGASYLSPRMKARMQELGLHAADLAGIAGSGAGGRVTIQDFEKFIAGLEIKQTSVASNMRVAVADAMRRSWTRPLATVGMQVNLEPMLLHRRKLPSRPSSTLYSVRSLALALAEDRRPAGRLVGQRIIHPLEINIGFAVEVAEGVLVPVLKNADQLDLLALLREYKRLLDLAREQRVDPDSVGTSIATVTNYGTFGLDWGTPVPLPEQTLVLGIGAGRRMPFWDVSKKQFVPRMEACLTLSFDHRVLDGGAAGRLLGRVVHFMQHPNEIHAIE